MNESVQTEDREQIVEAIWNRARKTLPKMMSPESDPAVLGWRLAALRRE